LLYDLNPITELLGLKDNYVVFEDKWKKEIEDSIDAYSALHDPIQIAGVLEH
jgi:hypothetical protein